MNREGGGGNKDGDNRRQEANRKAGPSGMRTRRTTTKNTLPLGGRVEGHIRLYGERGKEGKGERDRNHEKLDEGPRVSKKFAGLKDRGQEPRD